MNSIDKEKLISMLYDSKESQAEEMQDFVSQIYGYESEIVDKSILINKMAKENSIEKI